MDATKQEPDNCQRVDDVRQGLVEPPVWMGKVGMYYCILYVLGEGRDCLSCLMAIVCVGGKLECFMVLSISWPNAVVDYLA